MSNKFKGEITYDVYINNKFRLNKNIFYYLGDIKRALKKNKLNISGSKKELETRLCFFYDTLYSHQKNNIGIITKIQKKIKDRIYRNKIITQGIGIVDKSKCVNHEDFYTFENINEVDDVYFFSYEKNNKIFFFDIRSFRKLIKHTTINPYTQEEIPHYVIKSYIKRRFELKKLKISLKQDDIYEMTPDQVFNARVVEVLQKIDSLNIVAGGVDIKWFTELNSPQLKMYYRILEDIWNYRANLSIEAKKLIVPNNNIFRSSINEVCAISNSLKRKIQYILLDTINTFVSSSPDETHRGTGGYFVLTGLVEISHSCAMALPWLIQYT
jgi:hypothetical protein